ncbi:integrase catalytic domain-containing protein [Trichonephila clavipes]|nr:integrase catalytic domain-containing protein [Trichonephila clavipes]
MDNLLTGADDLESGRKLQVQLVSMLKGAGMELHKWSASNPLLLPDSMCQVKDLSYSSSTETKTLGLLWKPHPDSFAFKISPMTSNCDNLIATKKSELCGAVLLSKILKRTLDAFKDNISQIYLWTDSSIVLAWIKKPIAQLKTFVRNRASIVKELTESDFWKHLNSENNPADILSRGAEATLANIRNNFWIPSARNVVRKILRTCFTCRKVSAKGWQQLMADSSAAKVTACRDFSQVVKAIHLEIVSDLTTEAFLSALKRFVVKRGRPIEIHSDNGRNFVGANNELRKILKALFKVQIEAVLNSRPICPLSNDPNDVETLTPAHFLVGSSLVAVPDPDYIGIPMSRLNRWQLVQRMNRNFWRKWSSEYLNRQQQETQMV